MCTYYDDAVDRYGVPHTLRVDRGTENCRMNLAQEYLSVDQARLSPLDAVVIGSSNPNEVSSTACYLIQCKQLRPFEQISYLSVGDANVLPYQI